VFSIVLSSLVRLLAAGALVFLAVDHRHEIIGWFGMTPSAGSHAEAPPASRDDFGGGRTLRVRADRSGHFLVDADVDGTTVRFMVDTGASDVVLTPEDAERLGLRLHDRDYTLKYRTAGGIVKAAPVSLREISIGALSVRDVPAAVNSQSIGVSLLGMSFLKRLDGYAVERDSLILTW
jgi:aspartyl protease family protein